MSASRAIGVRTRPRTITRTESPFRTQIRHRIALPRTGWAIRSSWFARTTVAHDAVTRSLAPTLFLFVLTGLGSPLAGQVEPRVFRSPDGSEFLLAPTELPQIDSLIHWVVVTPSGPTQDPPGRPGLSRAVMRASLSGTPTHGSLDWRAEQSAIAQVEAFTARVRQLELQQSSIPAEARALVQQAERERDALSDPSRWLAEMRSAPATGIELVETAGSSLLRLTTRQEGIARVAELVLDRRENAVLRGFRRQWRQLLNEERRRREGTRPALRHEALAMATADGRIGPLPEYVSTDSPWAEARTLYRELSNPARSRHVLTGAFDIDQVETQLRSAFSRSNLPQRSGEFLTIPPPAGNRRSEVRGPNSADRAAAIGIALPDDLHPMVAEALALYLINGSDAAIPRAFREAGYDDIRLETQAPFPADRSPGWLLVEVIESRDLLEPGQASNEKLLDLFLRLLDRALKANGGSDRWNRAWQTARVRRAEAWADPAARAVELATTWGSQRRPIETLFEEPERPTIQTALQRARALFANAPRISIGLEDA